MKFPVIEAWLKCASMSSARRVIVHCNVAKDFEARAMVGGHVYTSTASKNKKIHSMKEALKTLDNILSSDAGKILQAESKD